MGPSKISGSATVKYYKGELLPLCWVIRCVDSSAHSRGWNSVHYTHPLNGRVSWGPLEVQVTGRSNAVMRRALKALLKGHDT